MLGFKGNILDCSQGWVLSLKPHRKAGRLMSVTETPEGTVRYGEGLDLECESRWH